MIIAIFSSLNWRNFLKNRRSYKFTHKIQRGKISLHPILLFIYLFILITKSFFSESLLTFLLKELIIPRKLRPILSPPVYDIKHLYLRVSYCSRFQYIIDRMLWMCHPQTLSIQSGTNVRFLKVINFLPQC